MRLLPDLVLVDGRFEPGRAVEITDGRIPGVVRFRPPGAMPPSPTMWCACPVARCCPVRSTATATPSSHCCAGSATTSTSWAGAIACSIRSRRGSTARASSSAPRSRSSRCCSTGVTTCVDFFYLQDDGQRQRRGGDPGRARRRASGWCWRARMYDWDGAPERYRESAGGRGAPRARADPRRIAGDTVTVQPAPHSPHGASPAMIRAGWEVAEAADTRVSHPRGRGPVRGRANARASTARRRSATSTGSACWARG